MRHRLELVVLLLTLASPAAAQRGPRLEVTLLAHNSPPAGANVVASQMLDNAKVRELLRNGFPAALTFRLELWRASGFFDELEATEQWNVWVRYDPYSQQYLAVRRHGTTQEDFGGFPNLEAVEEKLRTPYPVFLRPRRIGTRYYYNIVLDVESLSVSDLDELQRWLKGELQPAVRGKRAPLSALKRGFGTLLSRLLGGETKHYEARSGTFRA
ncbi:MAG: hypothetical protein ACRENU_03250 [Gemmatimonadaceae bacterium]